MGYGRLNAPLDFRLGGVPHHDVRVILGVEKSDLLFIAGLGGEAYLKLALLVRAGDDARLDRIIHRHGTGYGRLHRGARDLCPVPEGATVERVAHVYRLAYAVGDVDLDDVLALSRENDQRAPLVSA